MNNMNNYDSNIYKGVHTVKIYIAAMGLCRSHHSED